MPEVITMGKGAEEFAEFPEHTRLLLICINKQYEKLGAYNAVRYSWTISPKRAAQAKYVLAVVRGKIVDVFEAREWLTATEKNFSPGIPGEHGNWKHQRGKFGFHGNEAPDDIREKYMGKEVPKLWRHKQNPIRYVNF
jgi:hypothetical protein